jgi:hypothetical protein
MIGEKMNCTELSFLVSAIAHLMAAIAELIHVLK